MRGGGGEEVDGSTGSAIRDKNWSNIKQIINRRALSIQLVTNQMAAVKRGTDIFVSVSFFMSGSQNVKGNFQYLSTSREPD